ncbi:MAG TPA: MFS transporter [Alphaproteobacteria bacterium]|nr:MFS transporter [Alphaproteobacteria bacterium]
MPQDKQAMPGRWRVIGLVAVLCGAYMISQFLRSSTGVIAPELSRDLQLAPGGLGVLSGAFFFSFALAQIPVGLMLDRYGARNSMVVLMIFAIVGCVIFARADGLLGLGSGRVMMGVGCACLLMGPLMIYTRWFPADRFATLSGIQIAAGTLGVLLATTPLAAVSEWIGWRGAFWALAVITALMALLVLGTVRNAPAQELQPPRPRESLLQSMRGLGAVLRNPALPYIFALQFVAYGAMISVLGLWGAPFLNDVYGLDGPGRGNILLLMSIAVALGMLFWGPLDRRMNSRKRPILLGGAGSASALLLLALAPGSGLVPITGLFIILGFCNGYTAISLAHGRSIFPDALVGRGITLLNMGNMAGAGLLQFLAGLIIGQFVPPGAPAPVAAYQLVFGFLALSLIAALLFYRRIADCPPNSTI